MSSVIQELADLPLAALQDRFVAALGQGSILLEAEPGAGKSTLAPLWMLQERGERGQIWLVQPRILAARALADRVVGRWSPTSPAGASVTRCLSMLA